MRAVCRNEIQVRPDLEEGNESYLPEPNPHDLCQMSETENLNDMWFHVMVSGPFPAGAGYGDVSHVSPKGGR
jgi:hypothetical protein